MNAIVKIYKAGTQTGFERFKQKTVRGVLGQYRALKRNCVCLFWTVPDIRRCTGISITNPGRCGTP